MDETRAYNEEETRRIFLQAVAGIARYWLNESRAKTCKEKIDGAIFSVLVLIDGEDASLPAFTLMPNPHPEDEEYLRSIGENYFDPDVDIGGSLHDEWSKFR